MPIYHHRSTIADATPEILFAWHERPGAFRRLTPPWDPVRVLDRSGEGLGVGVELQLEVRVGPAPVRWTAVHTRCEPPQGFTDEARSGPFRRWVHHHRFTSAAGGALLEDEIEWEAPLGGLGAALGRVERRLERVFDFRHRRTRDDLSRHIRCWDRPRLRVLISGSSGLIGRELTAFLDAGGHEVIPLVRSRDRPGVYASFSEGILDPAELEGFDAVIHLAGAPIATERWSDARREVIRRSRIDSTALLARTLASLSDPPEVFISGSAVGVYGDSGDAVCTEEASAGDTFLAGVCTEWEAAARPAQEAGIRVVYLRTGLVLSGWGGMLGLMVPLFQAGLGGRLGSGRQQQAWIHLDDHLGLVHEILFDPRYRGPINATAPSPVRQSELAGALGRVLHRPALAPTPAAALRLALGRRKADELVLQGQRAVPAAAEALGFSWLYPELEPALAHALGR
ncbi:MAG TPA: TIGR01777 family protein [Deltaproteobacteria bacterium]|nr:TIGR01777 family protein [Deltaproteobacteria bacterium]